MSRWRESGGLHFFLWLLPREQFVKIVPHDWWSLCSVDEMPKFLLFAVIDDRDRLRVE